LAVGGRTETAIRSWNVSTTGHGGEHEEEGIMGVMTVPDVWSGQDRVLTVEDMENIPDDEFRHEPDDGRDPVPGHIVPSKLVTVG
jgi:hypothetical protein